ncbi:MAG: L-histidine N(alpha)-methyltransferase [Gemmatimonadota bacterium]
MSADPGPLRRSIATDVREGLGRPPRTLPPKYFYDARGSRLFEEITSLPEYYLTRTERSILERAAALLIDSVRPAALIEFGSGSSGKTEILLDEGVRQGCLRRYRAVDVSPEAVRGATERLSGLYPDLEVDGVVADFHDDLALRADGGPRLVLFLGSTIGNLAPAAAASFVRDVRERLAPADAFLVGFDLMKDRRRLVAAYDDARGVTAAFNRNALLVLNRHLGSDFDPEAFAHRAVWNEADSRIEMHLVSTRTQTIHLPALDMRLTFAPGESICTELSHKFTRESATRLLEDGEFRLDRWDTDADGLFAVALARPATRSA